MGYKASWIKLDQTSLQNSDLCMSKTGTSTKTKSREGRKKCHFNHSKKLYPKCMSHITQSPTPGFSKCMSHIFLHQAIEWVICKKLIIKLLNYFLDILNHKFQSNILLKPLSLLNRKLNWKLVHRSVHNHFVFFELFAVLGETNVVYMTCWTKNWVVFSESDMGKIRYG